MPDDLVAALRRELTAVAEPANAAAMAAYMQDHFAFLGVSTPVRRVAAKPFITAGKGRPAAALLDAADACWAQPEREFQYVGTDLLVRWVHALGSEDLPHVERLIRTKPWWDAVDPLAAKVVGPMVEADPVLGTTMDRWIDDDDIWIARTAILHQLKFRDATDVDRLLDFVDRRASSTEFFIRKAIGWALREYSKTEPDAVRRFVDDRGERLSGLSRREAMKHL